MKLAFITDIHEVVGHLEEFAEQVTPIDLLLVGGDFTNFGGADRVHAILELLRERFPRMLCLPGNLDNPDVVELLDQEDISLHGKNHIISGIAFFGVGGSNPTPMRTPTEFDERIIEQLLRQGFEGIEAIRPRILVSHSPPHQTSADRIFTGKHVGSKAVAQFLKTHEVELCLCGHIHEAASLDVLAETQVCNPGPFSKGRFALVEVSGDHVACTLGQVPLSRKSRIKNTAKVLTHKAAGFIRLKSK